LKIQENKTRPLNPFAQAKNIFASAKQVFGEWQAVNEAKIQMLRVILDN
jgi:hypothetical protein